MNHFFVVVGRSKIKIPCGYLGLKFVPFSYELENDWTLDWMGFYQHSPKGLKPITFKEDEAMDKTKVIKHFLT